MLSGLDLSPVNPLSTENLSEMLSPKYSQNYLAIISTSVLCKYMYLCIFIAQPHTHVLKPHLEPGSEEGIIEMLGECEQKLVSLVEELGSRDLDTIQKEMEDEEVIDNLSQCSPVYVHVPNLLCLCNASLLYI